MESGSESKSKPHVLETTLMPDWENALSRMHKESEGAQVQKTSIEEVVKVTTSYVFEDLEKYLTDHFNDLTQCQKDFILQSLRVKKFRRDHHLNQ